MDQPLVSERPKINSINFYKPFNNPINFYQPQKLISSYSTP